MTQSKSYEEYRNLITEIQHSAGNSQILVYYYVNDSIAKPIDGIARREDLFVGDSSLRTNQFGYNLRSEVTSMSSCAVMAAGSAMPSEFAYLYDNLGNRITASEPTALATSYAANELNQYSSIANNGTAVALEYDLDGNLLSDGTWHYVWNGENRLIQATNATSALTFAYDFQGRRHQKGTQTFLPVPTVTTNTFIYDGWNLIAEVGRGVPSAPQSTTFHLWGIDLSGSLQGAGGVGGLLSTIKDNANYFTAFDANGNVSDYVDTAATVAAHYEYGPFGTITSTGTNSEYFTFRFSTKYEDDETGLCYYGYRSYSVVMGRWLNRDPIEELDQLNLYMITGNDIINLVDFIGLATCKGDADVGNVNSVSVSLDTVLMSTKKYTASDASTYIKDYIKGKAFGDDPTAEDKLNSLINYLKKKVKDKASYASWIGIAVEFMTSTGFIVETVDAKASFKCCICEDAVYSWKADSVKVSVGGADGDPWLASFKYNEGTFLNIMSSAYVDVVVDLAAAVVRKCPRE